MKKAVALLFLLTLVSARADDANLLQNGNFADGSAHWSGDAHAPDSGSVDLTSDTSTAPSTGVVVKLRHHDWTKVTQDFDGKVGEYNLTIIYSLSPGLKLSTVPDDYTNVPGKVGYSLLPPFNSDLGRWVVIVVDMGVNQFSRWLVSPTLNVTDTQTLKARVNLDSGDEAKKGFSILFPPGDGLITLTGITLAPASSGPN